MSFLLRSKITAYSEKEAQSRLTEMYEKKNNPSGDAEDTHYKTRDLVEHVNDIEFLVKLYDISLNTDKRMEYFERKYIVDRVLKLDQNNHEFRLHVIKSDPEKWVSGQAFEDILKLDDEKTKKKLLQLVKKQSKSEDIRERAAFELAGPEELKAIALAPYTKRGDEELKKQAISKLSSNEDLMKELFDDFSKSKKMKKGDDNWWEETNERERLADAALSHIKDQAFLKAVVKKYGDKKPHGGRANYERIALQNIEDEAFLIKHLEGHQNTHTIKSIVTRLNDETVLKSLYEQFGEAQKGKKGYDNEQWTELRSAIIKRLSKVDPDFIMNLILKEKKKNLRLAALDQIEDEEILKKLINKPKLAFEVKQRAMGKIKDLDFLRDLALSTEDEYVAMSALSNLIAKSKTDQETYIKFYETFPEAKELTYEKSRTYLIKEAPQPLATYKRVVFSQKFPLEMWKSVIRWPSTVTQVQDLIEFCKVSNDVQRVEDAAVNIMSNYKKFLPKTDEDNEDEGDNDDLKAPAPGSELSKADVMSGLSAAFSKVKTTYKLKNLTEHLPSEVVINTLKQRPDLNSAVDEILEAMKLDDTGMDYILSLKMEPENLYKFFESSKVKLSSDYAYQLIKKLKPAFVPSRYNRDEKTDYRVPLVDEVKSTKDLEDIAEHDKSKSVRWTALRQLYHQNDRNPDVLLRIIENDADENNVSWAMRLMPEDKVDLKWGDRFVDALSQANGNSHFQPRFSDQLYADLVPYVSKEHKSSVLHRMRFEGENSKKLAEQVLKDSIEDYDKAWILEKVADKELYEQHLLHDPSYKVRKTCFKHLNANSAEVMFKVYKEDQNPALRSEALCFISPDMLTPEMVAEFADSLKHTDRPHEVDMSLKVRAYQIAPTEDLKSHFRAMLPNRLLDKDDQVPSDQRQHSLDAEDARKGEKIDSASGHQEQLLRLLLTMAKPPKDKQAAAAEYKSLVLSKYKI